MSDSILAPDIAGASPASDFLTILTCGEGYRCAKLYRDPEQAPDDYDAGMWFEVETIPVADLDALAQVLDRLRHAPRSMVVRGRLRPEAATSESGRHARRCVDRPDEPAAFERANHRWLMVDADATEAPFDRSDPAGSVERWRAVLPEGLRGAACVFQFSAKQHLSPTVRGHAWFWCAGINGGDERFDDALLRSWAGRHGFDGSLYTPVQPHFVADPVFDGCEDPLAPRDLVRLSGGLAVLDIGLADLQSSREAAKKGYGLSFDELGAADESPEAVARRAKICDPLRKHFREKGRKFQLCGAVAGACRKAGLPAEECDAIVTELLLEAVSDEGDDPECNIDKGRAWALGAYDLEKPAQALGIKQIAELTARAEGRPSLTPGRFSQALDVHAHAMRPAREASPANDGPAADSAWSRLPFEHFPVDQEPPPLDYVWGPFAAGKVSAIIAFAYGGKTPFGLSLGIHVARGKEFAGKPTKSRKTLYIAHEGARNARLKAQRICRGLGFTLADIADSFEIVGAPTGSLNPQYVADLEAACGESDIGVVLLDTYGSALDFSIDRNAAAFSECLKLLGEVSDRTGVLFVVLLHERKTDAGKRRGSALEMVDGHNSAAGALQAAITLTRPEDDDDLLFEVSCARAPEDSFEPFRVRWADVSDPTAKTPGAKLGSGGKKWGLRLESAEPGEKPEVARARARRETTCRRADLIEQFLADDSSSFVRDYTTGAVKSALGMNGPDWAEALAECMTRRTVSKHPKGKTVVLQREWPATVDRPATVDVVDESSGERKRARGFRR